MNSKLKYALIALPAALALSACGNPQEKQAEAVQEKTLDQPGFEGKSATPSEAQSEAISLAQHLSSDTLEAGEAAIVLEDLDPKTKYPVLLKTAGDEKLVDFRIKKFFNVG